MPIRELVEKDANACSTIANEAFADEIQRGMDSFTDEYFVKRVSMKNLKLVVAEEKGRIEGFMLITDANIHVPAQLHLVAVNKNFRGKGVGKTLVNYAIDYTIENAWKKIKLSTRPWNTPMRKICTSLGFIEEAHLRKEYLGEDLIQYGYFPYEK